MTTSQPGQMGTSTSTVSQPSAEPLLVVAEKRLLPNYRQAPFVLDRGQGSVVFDTLGRRYLDLSGGVAVSSVGHAHPKLTSAIASQAARLMHMSNYFYNAENIRLADELCTVTGFDRAFFCNSGTEANEALLKLARHHFYSLGQKDKYRIVAFRQSFHGRTMGALAMTGNDKYREGFGPGLTGVTHVDYGNVEAVRAVMDKDVAAIIVEPIQGEGGVNVPKEGFLSGLRAVADEFKALLLADEVQTGIGRTGYWLGVDHEKVRPDAVALAKGLGGGFPIGAILVREELSAALPPGTHGSTFGGNALASAAARSVISILKEENLLEATARKGQYLEKALTKLVAKYPKIAAGVRGRGLLFGLCLAEGIDARGLLGRIRDRGVLLTIAGANVLRFSPPLVIREDELDEAVGQIDQAFGECP